MGSGKGKVCVNNPVPLTSTAGNIVNSYEYDEWGKILNQTEAIANDFKYSGEIQDSETGFYYLRARYYDPKIGRFISEDSNAGNITNPLSLNLYTYCENNPLKFVDPSGFALTDAQIAYWRNEYSAAPWYAKNYVIFRFLGASIATSYEEFRKDYIETFSPMAGGDENAAAAFDILSGYVGGQVLSELCSVRMTSKANFASIKKLQSHFEKHGSEFKGAYKNVNEYLAGARDVISNGLKITYKYKGEMRTGYVRFMGNSSKGVAKFEFVGTNEAGQITTYHVESGNSFWKLLNGSNEQVINVVE